VNRLVEEIIKPILEANSNIKKVVGIYGGRFQPFGPHHYKTYKWLTKQVDEAYITTSNIKKPPRHPMNFKEKVRHMSKMGVPSNRIIEEKSPYVAKNLAKKYDKDTTAFVYVFGAKDAGRLGGGGKYFQDYKKNKNNINGYEENGYYLVAPHVSISVGGKEVSGTTMRELLGSDKFDDKQRVKLFKKMFGYYDKGVFTMMSNKFKKLFEDVVTWDNTKPKPKNPKHFDEKDRDLLHDISLEKAIKKLKIPQKLMKGNKQKLINYLTTNPQMVTQLIRLATEGKLNEGKKEFVIWGIAPGKSSEEILYTKAKSQGEAKKIIKILISKHGVKKARIQVLDLTQNPVDFWKSDKMFEGVDLPIEIGDTVRMGKFKNKKVVIKTIDWNEKGDLLINGRPALKFRIEKSKEIDEFLIHTNISKIIKEISSAQASGLQAVDSGPSAFMYGMGGYSGRNKEEAEKLGWEVVNYILDVDVTKIPPFKDEFGGGKSVSYLPAGIGTGGTPNNPENLTGAKGYNKWVKNMKKIAQEVGFKLIKFKDEVETKKQISKDSTATLKQQKSDEKDIKNIKVEENVFTKDWWNNLINKELLTEGGAYGHMAHPFDDKDLTFGDLKKIIEDGLGGTLSREDGVTEKLDGQNIMISWKDGKLIAARNKGHIKNGGKTALDTNGIISKFKGRGDIKDAFVFAMKDLGKAIKSLSDKQKEKIFNNGYNFMNLEVMWPKSENVVNYDKAELVFHGALVYDDKGNVKGEVKGSGRVLAGMIKQRNQNIQKKYKIGKPVFLDVPKHQDFGTMKSKFIGELNKLRNQYGLKDNDTLGLYHQSYWEEYIYNAAQQFNYDITDDILENLTKRWAFFDKSYKIPTIRKELKDESEFLEWVLKTDKENHAKMVKENMKPFEELFFGVGAEILKNVKGFMAANPDKSVQSIRKKLKTSIENVKASGNKNKLNTLKLQLDKLNKIGGVDAIVPSEGIVFKYKGKTYKFTGAFAPINQITGLIYF